MSDITGLAEVKAEVIDLLDGRVSELTLELVLAWVQAAYDRGMIAGMTHAKGRE